MLTDRTKQLVYELDAWYSGHQVRQKDLAAELQLKPQQLAEILALRNRPTGEQALRIVEFLETESMKSELVDPPKMPQPSVRDPNEPQTLLQAKEQLEAARQTIAQLKSKSAAAGPTPNPPPAQAPPTNPSDLPGFKRVQSPLPPPAKQLPKSANTPFLIGEILKVTNFEDCLSLLANPAHTPLQQSLIYSEVKSRRDLTANRQ